MVCSWISCLLLLMSLAIPATGQSGVSVVNGTAPPDCHPAPPLAADAEQVATQIGIMPWLNRLRALSSACDQSTAVTLEEIVLHQRITEAVVMASLDVDAVVSEIDYERAQILQVRDLLSSARDRKINLLSLANIVAGTGSGILTNAMQFSDSTAMAGDAVGVGGGAAGVVLSILGLRVQGGKASLGIAPNMLAPLFGRNPELRSIYPQDVWMFLNTAPASDPRIHVPWREELINAWVQEKRIGPPDDPGSQKKIDLLTSRIAEHKRLPIDVLTDRTLMLLDLRARVTLMKRDLRALLSAVNQLRISVPAN
jgi:hypothetical protein